MLFRDCQLSCPHKCVEPILQIFNYMGPNPSYKDLITQVWPEGGSNGYRKVQSIGPSPVVIHKKDLEAIAKTWEDTAVALKTNPRADSALGWVIEMWGYCAHHYKAFVYTRFSHRLLRAKHWPRLHILVMEPTAALICGRLT